MLEIEIPFIPVLFGTDCIRLKGFGIATNTLFRRKALCSTHKAFLSFYCAIFRANFVFSFYCNNYY